MKPKRLIQILVVIMLVFSTMGGSQPALASSNSSVPADAMVINRNLNLWDATYFGFVNSSIYEKWHFDFTESHNFVVTVSPITGGFIPFLTLFDSNGIEIASGTGSLTSTQPAGSYSLQVQPESGGGFYLLTLREVVQTQPGVSTVVSPSNVNVGESAVATVSLNNVPVEGYTSAEFTCTYDASLVEVSNIVVTNLFGADPAAAITSPQNGSFIVAIAGSNGNKATTSGAAFTFSVRGLQAGQSVIQCTARVSKGDNVLTDLSSTGTSLTIVGSAPSPTPIESPTSTAPGPVESPTSTLPPVESPTPTTTTSPLESPTPTATVTFPPVETATPTFTFTPVESATPTFTFTPIASPTPLPNGTLTGQVIASKPVTVSLYDAGNTLITSVTANPDGTFSLTAPAGTYTVFATASGFLSAQGSAVLNPGSTTTKPNVSLLAGDIDNNNVIDPFDALTIGINYNSASPAAADLNNDGVINVLDLELLAQNYRETGPIVWE